MFHRVYQSLLCFYWSDYERIHLELATAFAMNQKRLLLNWFRASNYITCKMKLPCWLFGKGTEQTNTDPANLHKWYTILSCVLNTSHFLYEMYLLEHMQAFLIQLLLKLGFQQLYEVAINIREYIKKNTPFVIQGYKNPYQLLSSFHIKEQ